MAHESLLRQWDAVAEWLRAERDDLKDADRLEQAAAAWTRNHRGADWLIQGARLAAAETLAAKPSYRRRLERVADFLFASRERAALRRAEEERVRQAELDLARERQAAAESLAEEQQRAAERAQADAVRLRTRGRQLAGLLLAAASVAAVAVWFAVEANRQSLLAGQRFNQAMALRLLGEGQAMIVGTRAGGVVPGLLRLLAAHRLAPHPPVTSVKSHSRVPSPSSLMARETMALRPSAVPMAAIADSSRNQTGKPPKSRPGRRYASPPSRGTMSTLSNRRTSSCEPFGDQRFSPPPAC